MANGSGTWSGTGTVVSRTDLFLNPWQGDGSAFTPIAVLFDQTDECIFAIGREGSGGLVRAFKYHQASAQYKWFTEYPDITPPQNTMEYSRLMGGSFGWAAVSPESVFFNQIDINTGELLKSIEYDDFTEFGEPRGWGQAQHWDDTSSSLVIQTATAYRRIFFRGGNGAVMLSEIIAGICDRTGMLGEADIDLTGLQDQECIGYMVDREATARDLLKQLANGYYFDGYESDYKLKFRSRGNAPNGEITQEWIARDGDDKIVSETLLQELELPMKVTFNFYDYDRDYQEGSASVKRINAPVETMLAKKEEIVDLPMVWQATSAKRAADKGLKMIWANRSRFDLKLPWRYLKYEPTDVVSLSLNGNVQHTIRITGMTIGADFALETQGVSEKASAYLSEAEGSSGEGMPGQQIPTYYPTTPVILNTPLLRDLDYNTTGNATTYVSATTTAKEFPGSVVFMNAGSTWETVATVDESVITGVCLDALPQSGHYEATDNETVLRIKLNSKLATLESVETSVMLDSYANAALIGTEVIQFRDAILHEDGFWRISGILRARRGTNYAVNGHRAGENFLLLTNEALDQFTRPPEAYYTQRSFKAVTPGTIIDDAKSYSYTLAPVDLMPFTPEDFEITDDGTDIMVSMSRRSRITAPLFDGGEFVGYKEGQITQAKIDCQIWAGKGVTDIGFITTDNTITPTASYSVKLFNTDGTEIGRPSFIIPLATALTGSVDRFLIRAYEVGLVDGIPKWIEFVRIDEDRWDMTEAY